MTRNFRICTASALFMALGCEADPALTGDTDAGIAPRSHADAAASSASTKPSTGGCSAVRGELLGQVNSASNAEVNLEDSANPKILYIDASAGGFQNAANNPYVYVNLQRAERVDISDPEADTSLDWDLAFKRFTIRTNGGDSGSGAGGAAAYEGALEEISASTISEADLVPDDFLDDATCEPIGASESGVEGIATAFSAWYSYDSDTMVLTPRNLVYVVRSAQSGALYKLQISDYYASPAGGSGPTSGRFRIAYQALEEASTEDLQRP